MRTIAYRGEIWSGPAVAPGLWDLLLQKDLLLELAAGEPPYRVILGVPHHAAPGVDCIAENWIQPGGEKPGRPADEIAGLSGLAVLQALSEQGIPTRLVIAAHATDHDPNKTPGSPYWQSIFAHSSGPASPILLFELHGAGMRRHYDLELSAGRNRVSAPLAFGEVLAASIPGAWRLAVQSRPGTSAGYLFHPDRRAIRLENPALGTQSLSHAGELGMPALHLEMKTFLRQPDADFSASPRPAPAAWILARAIAAVIKMIY